MFTMLARKSLFFSFTSLQGQLAPKLLVLVNQVFDLLDKQCVDAIDPPALIAHFDASRHPEVLTRATTADAVLKEFLDTFDVGGEKPGKITRNEFVRYYTNISASASDAESFELVLRSVWSVPSGGELLAPAAPGRGRALNANSLAANLQATNAVKLV